MAYVTQRNKLVFYNLYTKCWLPYGRSVCTSSNYSTEVSRPNLNSFYMVSFHYYFTGNNESESSMVYL